MNDLEQTTSQVQAIKMNAEAFWPLLVSFLLGSFTSAWWTLRIGKSPKLSEVTSSCVCSGIVAVGAVAWFSDNGLTFGKMITLSIACGFAGDIIIRVFLKNAKGLFERIFGINQK